MSVCRKLPDGTIQKIAGHTILLDANAQEVRTGTATTDSSTTAEMHVWQITFSDPMPDTDYEVMVYFGDESTKYGEVDVRTMWRYTNKTTTGFKASYFSGFTTAGAKTVHYIAWKPVKIEGYTELQNKINNPDNTPTIDSMNLVTSDGVARAIENASAVWKGTRAEWNALPATTKIKYDLAVITDGGLIKSVDRTTGDSDDVADLTKVWTGTQAEWDAMTQAQKNKWDKAMIQDGYYGITPAVLPVGCVQAYMGSVEPPGWLLCNGQTFDASVYPDLYNVLGINKVPELRGEFLRGAGPNQHSGQGSGDVVGAHQDATIIPFLQGYTGGAFISGASTGQGGTTGYLDYIIHSQAYQQWSATNHNDPSSYATKGGTVRPTNTSVNWIIFAGPAQ